MSIQTMLDHLPWIVGGFGVATLALSWLGCFAVGGDPSDFMGHKGRLREDGSRRNRARWNLDPSRRIPWLACLCSIGLLVVGLFGFASAIGIAFMFWSELWQYQWTSKQRGSALGAVIFSLFAVMMGLCIDQFNKPKRANGLQD